MIIKQLLNATRPKLRSPQIERFFRDRISNYNSLLYPLFLVTIPRSTDYQQEEQRTINLMGYDFTMYPSNYFQWSHYFKLEDQVLNVLLNAAEHANVILDIGANIGLYSLGMAGKTKGEVYAFEPNPKSYNIAKNHIETNNINNIKLYKLGLSDQVSTAILHNESGDLGRASLRAHPPSQNDVEVEISTVDVFLETHQINKVDLIKIDVEGLEMAVIRGGWKTIESQLPHIIFEITPDWMDESDFETYDRLHDIGYIAINIITQRIILNPKRECQGQHNLLLIHTSKLDELERMILLTDEDGNPRPRLLLSGVSAIDIRHWLVKFKNR